MSFNKNQKSYNKEVMRTGRQANQYLRNSLGLINKYTTNYADRTDFWTNKLNDRQLNLLSDKFLAQNANMLRGQAAFGSNSQLNQQINQNAYDQQNYLANVANQNVMNANQLQNNELAALMNASKTYQSPINAGATAAANVDAANKAWLQPISQGLQAAGAVTSFIPGGQAIGAGLGLVGNALGNIASPATSAEGMRYQDDRLLYQGQAFGTQLAQNLSTRRNNQQIQSTLSNMMYDPLDPSKQNSMYGK